MKVTMSSRERLLTAIRSEEPDHVPLWNLWSHLGKPDRAPLWSLFIPKDDRARVQAVLELGMDDTVSLTPPNRMAPEVTTRSWSETWPGVPGTVTVKEYRTPKGTLRQAVRSSEHWTASTDIPLLGDLNISHGVKMLVENRDDLLKLPYLFRGPDAAQIRAFREHARSLRAFADEQGVLLEGGWLYSGDGAVWLCGVERLIYQAVDDPGFVEELLAIIWQQEKERLSLLLDEGVDTIVHRGWYDIPDFWSLDAYRRFLKPILRREIEMTHQAGARFCYILTKGVMPLLDDVLDLGIDILWGVDPVQGEADLRGVKGKLGGKVCVWGGMNSAVTLGLGSEEEIRDAVTEAIRVLAPGGGFVLFPVDQILPEIPWEKVMTMVERWREIADYPISVEEG